MSESMVRNFASPCDSRRLDSYLREIRSFPLLDSNELFKHAKAYFEEEDLSSRDVLIQSHLRWAFKISGEYFKYYSCDPMDIVGEGNFGLVKAVDNFDYRREVKLTTYSAFWIRQSISRFMDRNSCAVHIPAHQRFI